MILVTGSLAFDFIMNFSGKFSDYILPEKIHTINLSFPLKTLRKERGGCAANIAYNLALLGEKPVIVGVLGKDGGEYKQWLKKKGVDVSMVKIIKSKGTASAFMMTDAVDNQIIGFYSGAMSASAKLKIKNEKLKIAMQNLKLSWKDLFVVIAPNDPLVMIRFARECEKLNVPYLFDPGMQLPRFRKKDLAMGIKGAKIIIGNDYEMSLIKRSLSSDGGRVERSEDQIWITTLGSKGSIIRYKNKKIKIKPAKPRNTSDPTGAGDAFRAGFLYGYCRGFDLKTSGQIGSLCAVYTVEKYGTTTHRFTKKEFKKRYKENFEENVKL